jgi:hypothetical protein
MCAVDKQQCDKIRAEQCFCNEHFVKCIKPERQKHDVGRDDEFYTEIHTRDFLLAMHAFAVAEKVANDWNEIFE